MNKFKKMWIILLIGIMLFALCACSKSDDTLISNAKIAWQNAMGNMKSNSTTAVSHIKYTSFNKLADSLGINPSQCNFASCGLFESSGHLWGIMHDGKPRYIVAMDDNGQITWIFNIQSWKTQKGYSRVSALEFSMLATAVGNGVKAVYPQQATATENVWHRLTDEQLSKLFE